MEAGVPLDDGDRAPWLEALCNLIRGCIARGEDAVLACSALKKSYRSFLRVDDTVQLIYLKGDYELIKKRLIARRGHYMNPALLDSQFETLEEPEDAIQVDVTSSPDEIVRTIRKNLAL